MKRRYNSMMNVKDNSYEGETIEKKVRRVTTNKEPIKDGAPLIYTNRKDGVQPAYNIRTDRFDIAVDAMNKVAQTEQAKRDEKHNPKNSDKDSNKSGDNNSGSTSVQAVDTVTPK